MRHAGLSQSTGGHARARLRSHDRLFFSAIRPAPPATPDAPARPSRPGTLARPRQACARHPAQAARNTAPRSWNSPWRQPCCCPPRLLAAEAATWQTVRQTVQLALMEAARAGAVSHAAPARMKAVFVQALRPLHGGDASRQARALREAALLADAHPWRIEVLRPDARDFRLHARPGLRIAPAPGLPAIDNDYQDLQHARAPGQATDIFQANTLSLRLTYLHKPLSAPLRALLVALARGAQTPPARQGAAFTGLAADDARGYAGQRWRAACCRSWWNWTWRCTRIRPIGRACDHGPRAWCREPAAGCAADDATARPGRQPRGGDGARAISDARPNRIGWRRACPATLPRRQPAWPARPSRRGPAWRRAWRPPRWPAMRRPPAAWRSAAGYARRPRLPASCPARRAHVPRQRRCPIQVAHFGFQRRIARAQASLVSFCAATWRCRSQTLNQPPLPIHNGYWIRPSSTNSTRNNRRIRRNPQQSCHTAAAGRSARPPRLP